MWVMVKEENEKIPSLLVKNIENSFYNKGISTFWEQTQKVQAQNYM